MRPRLELGAACASGLEGGQLLSTMRIATWNLERPSPRSWKKGPRQLERMQAIAADIWVLTETRASITPGEGYSGLHSPPHPLRRPDEDERWVSIWSRWPLKATDVPADPRGTASAIVETPDGPVVIYGTVIPYANEVDGEEPAGMWQSHYRSIQRQGAEWLALRQQYPQAPLVVAGDFNQDRDGSRWYGTHQGRTLLADELARADLACVTEEDVVQAGKLTFNHLVDHIAVSRGHLDQHTANLSCWEPTDDDGTRLSDHPTVVVDLKPRW